MFVFSQINVQYHFNILFKMFERLVFDRFVVYINFHGIFNPSPYYKAFFSVTTFTKGLWIWKRNPKIRVIVP